MPQKPDDVGNDQADDRDNSDQFNDQQGAHGNEEQRAECENNQAGNDSSRQGQQQPEQDSETQQHKQEENTGDQQHDPSSPQDCNNQDSVAQDTQGSAKEQEKEASGAVIPGQEESNDDAQLDEQEALLLKLLEERDAQTVKAMLKGYMKEKMPEHHGQKNW